MKNTVALLVILVLAVATGLFAVSQIWQYFTEKQVVVGSWSVGENETGVYVSEFLDQSESKVLGASTDRLELKTMQARVEFGSFHGYLFDKYFAMKGSPLTGHGTDFVEACKRYGAPKDCTLLPAIAKVETNFCKTGISEQQKNCWGWGGSGSNRILFADFEESIDTITRRLVSGYGIGFFENPDNGGGLSYCGAHCVNWGRHVKSEQNAIKNYLRTNGLDI